MSSLMLLPCLEYDLLEYKFYCSSSTIDALLMMLIPQLLILLMLLPSSDPTFKNLDAAYTL